MRFNSKTVYIILIILGVSAAGIFASSSDKILKKGDIAYLSNTLIVKLKNYSLTDNKVSMLSTGLAQSLTSYSVKSVKNVFNAVPGKTATGLEGIVELKYDSDADPFYLAAKIKNNPEVEWAEPRFLYKTSSVPNDPYYATQYNLSKINAAQAWDITKGDTNIVIGIVDTGVDWDHPDLAANIWINKNEIPNNGIDDDNNGYIDDVRGWDFGGLNGTPDNNPMEDRPDHGTHVAGIASAVTNNGKGVASIGYNSKLMAVKTAQDNNRDSTGEAYISYGYEGITYAVDNGAKIINCSWGGSGYSILAQQVINYAASKGVLVVVSAGNNNSSADSYPACYQGVLSVAATGSTDARASYSNYGKKIGVCAPGSSINSTWQNDTYAYLSGTSMASPLVAGLAALVASKFPTYTPWQLAEQIRVNCDNIDNVNAAYAGLLGSGRINAYKAVSNTASKSVRVTDVQFSDAAPGGNGNGVIEPGETITIACKFVNYLNPLSGLTVTLENKNSYSTITKSSFSSGTVGTLAEFNNYTNKFEVTIAANTPNNKTLDFRLLFSDGTYSDYQWISMVANPSYADQAGNNIALTITSKGALGFNDYGNNTQGNGFKYKTGGNLLFEGAFMLATSATKISNTARGVSANSQDADFSVVQPITVKAPGTIADVEGYTKYNDNASSTKLGITVEQTSYSFQSAGDKDYILIRYKLTNTNATAITNLYAGLFTDWDMLEATGKGDITQYDSVGKFGYVYHVGGSPNEYTAVALVSNGNPGYWGIMNDGTDGGFQIYDNFTDAEKWQALSSGIGKAQAGPGDISCVNSGGPYTIPAGGSVDVAFALAAGLSVADLRTSVANARLKFPQIIATAVNEKPVANPYKFALSQNYPNPFNPSTIVSYEIPVAGHVSLHVFDILGRQVATLVDEQKSAGTYTVEFNARTNGSIRELPSGIYMYRLQSGNYTETRKMVLVR